MILGPLQTKTTGAFLQFFPFISVMTNKEDSLSSEHIFHDANKVQVALKCLLGNFMQE